MIGSSLEKNFLIREVKVPRQDNGNDCGPAVLENIEQAILFEEFLGLESSEGFYPLELLVWKREEIIKLILGLVRRPDSLEKLLESFLKEKQRLFMYPLNSFPAK